MDGFSLDIRKEQIEKLKVLFPEVVSEDKIDWERLKATLGEDVTIQNERYVLNWAGKSDAFKTLQTGTSATLVPCKEESVNFDTTENIFIEGENLEVLKALQKSYFGKIKCIIIDPPYNTGSDSFVYPDKFSETKEEYMQRVGDKDEEGYLMKEGLFRKNSKENGQYHSNWLSMMYPRLFLAKNLLRDDGVIFVFIDDNEVFNLRLLLNEIFGEENFIGSIAWKHTQQSKNDEKYFSRHYNSIVAFSKSEKLEAFRFDRTAEHNKNYSNPDNDPNGDWRSGDVRSPNYRKTLCYDIITPSGKKILPPANGWRWSEETLYKKINTGEIIFDKDEIKIIRKIYLKNQDGRTPENLWDGEEFGTTRISNAEIKELFDNESIFDTPKPTNVISKILELISKPENLKNNIVLDFFAGSGTSGHTVLNTNIEESGNWKFILVQLPEKTDEKSEAFKAVYKTIADIGKERIRRLIKKIEEERKPNDQMQMVVDEQTELDLGFKVFKLKPSNFKEWRPQIENLEELTAHIEEFIDPIKPESLEENILFELLLKSGYDLNSKIDVRQINGTKYYLINDGEMAIQLSGTPSDIIDELIRLKPKKVIILDRLFENNDKLKTNTFLQFKEAGMDFRTV